jgi:hypothetical protein
MTTLVKPLAMKNINKLSNDTKKIMKLSPVQFTVEDANELLDLIKVDTSTSYKPLSSSELQKIMKDAPDAPIIPMLLNIEHNEFKDLEQRFQDLVKVDNIIDEEYLSLEKRFASLQSTAIISKNIACNIVENTVVNTFKDIGSQIFDSKMLNNEQTNILKSHIYDLVNESKINSEKQMEKIDRLANNLISEQETKKLLADQNKMLMDQNKMLMDQNKMMMDTQKEMKEMITKQQQIVSYGLKQELTISKQLGELVKKGAITSVKQAVSLPYKILDIVWFKPAYHGFEILLGPFYYVYSLIAALLLLIAMYVLFQQCDYYAPKVTGAIINIVYFLFDFTKKYLSGTFNILSDQTFDVLERVNATGQIAEANLYAREQTAEAVSELGTIVSEFIRTSTCQAMGSGAGWIGVKCGDISSIDIGDRRKSTKSKKKTIRKSTKSKKASRRKSTRSKKATRRKSTKSKKATGRKSKKATKKSIKATKKATGKKNTKSKKATGRKSTKSKKATGRKSTKSKKATGRKSSRTKKATGRKSNNKL